MASIFEDHMKLNKDIILENIFSFFKKSKDFNGIPLTTLSKLTKIPYLETIDIISELVKENQVSIQSDINPHIIALGHYDTEIQLKLLADARKNETKILTKNNDFIISIDSHLICVYPSPHYLKTKRNTRKYSHKPFSKRLALGEPHLKPTYFKLEVLDRYFRDPRYRFSFDDYSGDIWHKLDKNEESILLPEDEVFIKSFGLGVDSNKNRVVVVYLTYLNKLSPEHQFYWSGKEVKEECKMLNEYYINTIEGAWTNSHSIFSAFVNEQKAINDFSNEIFGTPIFNQTFENEKKPKEFTFFFIPTLKNYNDFVLLLDKMISDNLNRKFFNNKIELYTITQLDNNMIERKEKGSLQLFREWLTSNYINIDNLHLDQLFDPLFKVRKERQNPAHKINEDVYDESYIVKQKELIISVYRSMQALRIIFQNHPDALITKIPKWLEEGNIKVY